jgi:hypothetical protein
MFLFGGFMVSSSALKLYGYFATGNIHLRSRRLLMILSGPDAALFYTLFFLAGAFLLANGVRGLRRK